MRRLLVLPVISVVLLAGCGADPTVKVADLGASYGFADARAGQHIELATTTACVAGGDTATVTGVRLDGANTPRVESFAVAEDTEDRVGAAVNGDDQPVTGTHKVRSACPNNELIVIGATMPSVRVDIVGVTVTYEVDGRSGSTNAPLEISLCPSGDSGDEKCVPS